MDTKEYDHRDYKIVVTHKLPIFQAAIYPTKPGMVEIDWTTKPIEAGNIRGAELEARSRIDAALSR
jgi:hypothetical protein